MKKITVEQFNKYFKTKIFKGKWDAYITWGGLDMYELASDEDVAKERLLRKEYDNYKAKYNNLFQNNEQKTTNKRNNIIWHSKNVS